MGDGVGDVADLEPDLDADVVLEIDQGLDLELQAHVEVAHRLGNEAPCHRGSRGDHGDAVADVDFRLFLVLHADAGIGEQVGPAVGLPEREKEQRIGEGESHEVLVARAQLGQGENAGCSARPGRGGAADETDRRRAREADAQLHQPVVADFEHLDFEHHLRLGDVLRRDQLFREANGVRRVLHHQEVQLFVYEDVARLEDGANQVRGLPHVGVGDVKALDDEILVLAQLLRRVRVDERSGLVEDFLLELVGGEDQLDDVLDLRVAHDDRGPLVGAHVLVEQEVEIRRARDHVEYGAQGHILQLKGYGLGDRASQLEEGDSGLGRLLLDQPLQLACLALSRVLREHRSENVPGVAVSFGFHELVHLAEEGTVAHVHLHLRETLRRPRVGRIVLEHPAVKLVGRFELRGSPQGLRLHEPLCGGELAQAEILRAVGVVLGIFPRRLFERRERLVRAAFVQQRSRVLDERVGAGGDERQGERRIKGLQGGFHGVSPSLAGRK